MTQQVTGFNPRPSSFMGVLAWAATEARLKGFAFCPLAGERVGGCAVEWLSRSFDAMSPTHKFDVEVTDLATGTHTTFSVIRKQRTYRKTGKTTVRYNTPIGNFGSFDEVNAALVAEALAAAAARAEVEVEVTEEIVVQADVPVLTLDNPVTGPAFVPYLTGPFEQPQQRHFAQGQRPTLPLPERLHHLALVAKGHEVQAEPGSDARAIRGQRADHLAELAWAAGQGERHMQPEQQQAQAAASVLAAFEPECDRCGALLDERGGCPVCTPLRFSPPTHDLAGLLRGDGWGEERRELVTETADGKVTLRAVSGGVHLEVERADGAVAAVVLETGARLDLVTDLMQLGRAEAWGGQ